MTNQETIKDVVLEVLNNVPYQPFLCLPMSAIFYAILKDKHNIETKLVTGNLAFKGLDIFKQDFSVNTAQDGKYQTWAGHAWVEIENLIFDLSIFRTLYSDKFAKPCKTELIELFGKGRGCLSSSIESLAQLGLTYKPIDYLNDDLATGIIKGYGQLLYFHDN